MNPVLDVATKDYEDTDPTIAIVTDVDLTELQNGKLISYYKKHGFIERFAVMSLGPPGASEGVVKIKYENIESAQKARNDKWLASKQSPMKYDNKEALVGETCTARVEPKGDVPEPSASRSANHREEEVQGHGSCGKDSTENSCASCDGSNQSNASEAYLSEEGETNA